MAQEGRRNASTGTPGRAHLIRGRRDGAVRPSTPECDRPLRVGQSAAQHVQRPLHSELRCIHAHPQQGGSAGPDPQPVERVSFSPVIARCRVNQVIRRAYRITDAMGAVDHGLAARLGRVNEDDQVLPVLHIDALVRPNTLPNRIDDFVALRPELRNPVTQSLFVDVVRAALERDGRAERDHVAQSGE